MTDVESAKLAVEAAQLKSLEFLFNYTTFHIGLYLTLTASYVALASLKVKEKFLFQLPQGFLWVAIVAFIIAGIAGGVIASSITQCNCASSEQFLDQAIGPWGWEKLHFFRARTWTYIEHTSFWIGLVSAVTSFGVARTRG